MGRSKKRFVFFLNLFILFSHTCYICMFPAYCFHQRTYVAQGLVNGLLKNN